MAQRQARVPKWQSWEGRRAAGTRPRRRQTVLRGWVGCARDGVCLATGVGLGVGNRLGGWRRRDRGDLRGRRGKRKERWRGRQREEGRLQGEREGRDVETGSEVQGRRLPLCGEGRQKLEAGGGPWDGTRRGRLRIARAAGEVEKGAREEPRGPDGKGRGG